LALGLPGGLAGCKKSTSPQAGATLTVAGSTSVQPFVEKWAEQYMDKHPGTQINVQGGGSTAGVRAAQTGTAQIGTVSRDLKPDEASLHSIIVARDGIAVVVHPQNTITGLTSQQVRSIFSGAVHNWKEVGGPDRAITIITREEGSGTRTAFEELLMKKERIATSALVQDSTGAVRELLRNDPAAVGYISLGQLTPQVKALPLDGVEPTEANVIAGKYPLVRPFLFVTKGEPTGAAQDFVRFVLSNDGQALAHREGLVPVK
jgi:phosphate transport system substrate-binding protein